MGQEEEKQREWSHPERGQGDGSSQNEIPLRCSTKKLAIGTGGGDMEIREKTGIPRSRIVLSIRTSQGQSLCEQLESVQRGTGDFRLCGA